MNAFVWGAVVGGLVCLLVGVIAGSNGFSEDDYKTHIRTEWSVWFILLIVAASVSIYLYNYAGLER